MVQTASYNATETQGWEDSDSDSGDDEVNTRKVELMSKRLKLEEENRERRVDRERDEWDQAYDQGRQKKVRAKSDKEFTL